MTIKTHIKITVPGKIVDVSRDNKSITLEIPTVEVDGPMLTEKASKILCEGLSQMDADILCERIGHFAMTESIRSKIAMGCLSITRTEEPSKY
jgi:hypothetical protein